MIKMYVLKAVIKVLKIYMNIMENVINIVQKDFYMTKIIIE